MTRVIKAPGVNLGPLLVCGIQFAPAKKRCGNGGKAFAKDALAFPQFPQRPLLGIPILASTVNDTTFCLLPETVAE
jgi:hypothetical protein